MNAKFWTAVLVGGVVLNILDWLVQGKLFTSIFYSNMTDIMNPDMNVMWFVIGDFVAVFIFAWVYNKVGASFGGGVMGGVMCGLWLGIFATFPGYIFAHIMYKGYSYGLAWASIIYGVIWYMVAGAVVAAMMKKGGTTSAA